MSTDENHDIEPLLEYLKQSRGFDLTGYKRASLGRRVQKRMQTAGVVSYGDYVDYLEVHPEEFVALLNTILINVTSFFRDDATWAFMATDVLPPLLARRAGSVVRVWTAGVASGEEAYTIAMLLAEQMGPDDFRERVKIYATDVDDDALNRARQAVYTEHEVASVPPALLERYFDRTDAGSYAFNKELRRHVIFGRHDLIQDAPISRIDLLVCRNTLMYFNAETQGRILNRFHFALNDGGVLLLGRAETLLTHATTFAPIDLKRRIFTKVPRTSLNPRDRLVLAVHGPADDAATSDVHLRVREAAFDAAPIAQLVVDGEGALLVANERARLLFGLATTDFGRPLQDLRISYRPVELRSLIDQAMNDRRPIVARDVEWAAPSGEPRWFDLQVVPLTEAGGAPIGTSITFTDVTTAKRLQRDLLSTNHELEAAYEELQSTNEELETTNEELQSTVEELETTNEELQSTNEELETMNEELQSTNEELQALNEELRDRSDELTGMNGFLESIIGSLRGAVVVVDNELRVSVWDDRSEDLWGLRTDEVMGKHLLALDIGLPVERLKQPMKSALGGGKPSAEMVVDATNRRGRPIRVRVNCTRLVDRGGTVRGVILLMEEVHEAADGAEPKPVRRTVGA